MPGSALARSLTRNPRENDFGQPRDAAVVPLILACAEDDDLALLRCCAPLRAAGFQPELVPGVERDDSRLTEALTLTRGSGVFVVVAGPDLSAARIAHLTALFNKHCRPDHRLVLATFDPTRPELLVRQLAPSGVALRREDRPTVPPAHLPPEHTGIMPDWIRTPTPRPRASEIARLAGAFEAARSSSIVETLREPSGLPPVEATAEQPRVAAECPQDPPTWLHRRRTLLVAASAAVLGFAAAQLLVLVLAG